MSEQIISSGEGSTQNEPALATTESEAENPAGSPLANPNMPPETPKEDSRAQSNTVGEDGGDTSKATSGSGLLSADDDDQSQDVGTLGAPEGGYTFEDSPDSDVHIDAETREAFAAVAKELNLSQEAAQKVISKMEPALCRRVETLRNQWAEQCQTDEEFGGSAFKTNVKAIRRTYMATTTPELREVFRASGLDSNPEVLRHFYRLSKELGEGRYVSESGTRGGGDRSERPSFYKGMNP